MFASSFLSEKTWIMPVGNNAFMLDTEELPRKRGFVWYRRIRYTDIKGRRRSARLQICMQNEKFFSGVRLNVAHYKRCQFWNVLGGFGVFIRKIATASFARNAAAAGREQSIHNGEGRNASKHVAGPTGI